MKTYWKILVFGVFLALAQTLLLPAQTAPLPPGLTSARTAFVVNDGVWTKTFDKFFKELHKWGRFEFVAIKDEADIVIVLSHRVVSTGGVYTSTTNSGTGSQTTVGGVYASTTTARANTRSRTIQVPIKSSTYYIGIVDAANGELLWSDSKGTSFLGSNSAKGLVSNLKKRFKGVGYTEPAEKPERDPIPPKPQTRTLKGDGNELLAACNHAIRSQDGDELKGTQFMDVTYCYGYLGGFMDANALISTKPGNFPAFCIPETGLQPRQLSRIVVKWLNDHPEKLHLEDGTMVLLAMLEAFPCQNEASNL